MNNSITQQECRPVSDEELNTISGLTGCIVCSPGAAPGHDLGRREPLRGGNAYFDLVPDDNRQRRPVKHIYSQSVLRR
jgi:hypothetical protein